MSFGRIDAGTSLTIEDSTISQIRLELRDQQSTIEIFGLRASRELELWVDNGSNLRILEGTTIEKAHLAATEGANLSVGRDCMFATDVQARTGDSHSVLRDGRRINGAEDVTIGDHVWLAANAVILKGVRIGYGSVVGTCALVTRGEYPAHSMLLGTPARPRAGTFGWSRERVQSK